MSLDRKGREKILGRIARVVETKYFDPEFDREKWRQQVEDRRDAIVGAAAAEDFERAVHDLVSTLGTSHTAFFHRNLRPVPSRQAICATLNREETPDGPRWMFADVQEEGPADRSGIRPGELLLSINGEELDTEKPPQFRVGGSLTLGIRKLDSVEAVVEIDVPKPVVYRKLDAGNDGTFHAVPPVQVDVAHVLAHRPQVDVIRGDHHVCGQLTLDARIDVDRVRRSEISRDQTRSLLEDFDVAHSEVGVVRIAKLAL